MELLQNLHQRRLDHPHGHARHAFARHADRTVHLFDGRVVQESVENKE